MLSALLRGVVLLVVWSGENWEKGRWAVRRWRFDSVVMIASPELALKVGFVKAQKGSVPWVVVVSMIEGWWQGGDVSHCWVAFFSSSSLVCWEGVSLVGLSSLMDKEEE